MTGTDDTTRRYGHPGAGRRETRPYPKGRQVEPAARAEIAALLADRPMRRDLLVEHLHAIQDRFGHLAARHLAALAEAMHLSQVEVFEVATFYAHFDVVLDGEAPPPALTVRVCDSVSCALAGAERLAEDLARALGPGIRVQRVPCIGRCETAPAVSAASNPVHSSEWSSEKSDGSRRNTSAPQRNMTLICSTPSSVSHSHLPTRSWVMPS